MPRSAKSNNARMAKRRGEQPHSLNRHFHHIKEVKNDMVAKVKTLESVNLETSAQMVTLEEDLRIEHLARMECEREKAGIETELHKLESNSDRQASRARTSELEKKISDQNAVIAGLASGSDVVTYKSKYEKLMKTFAAFEKTADLLIFELEHERDMNSVKTKKISELELEIEELGYVKDQYEILKEQNDNKVEEKSQKRRRRK